MRRLLKRVSAFGFFLAMVTNSFAAAVVNWDYIVTARFITQPGITTFSPGSFGAVTVTESAIAWGSPPAGPAQPGVAGRSGIGISDTPKTGTLITNGAAQDANTYTHFNNVVNSGIRTLRSATLINTLALAPAGSGSPYYYNEFPFIIRFLETPNVATEEAPCVIESTTPCSDIWVLEGSLNQSAYIEGREYKVNFFPEPAPTPLPVAACKAVYETVPDYVEGDPIPECIGFTTIENAVNAVKFKVNVTYMPALVAVSGRVYVEGSSPANTQDNGNAVDPGTATQVSLSCTDPVYSAGPINTAADGSFSFPEVPAEANCAITTTPPSGYQAAYTRQGTTGEFGDATGALDTTMAGSTGPQTISISVPLEGSAGSLFALRPVTDMTSATVCTPNPAAAGATVSCTTTCTNSGGHTAFNAFCSMPNASSLPGSPAPVCANPTDLISGGTLTCTVNFAMPASGGINVTGGTGANNDSNGGTSATGGNNPSSTAVTRPGEVPVSKPTPVPGLGTFALLLLPGLMGLGALHQYRRRPGDEQG